MEPTYNFARFDPEPGREAQLRAELEGILEPTRAEPGCVRINLYESTRGRLCFYIHSQWIDEAAFDAHGEFPHMKRFLSIIDDLLTTPLRAIRTHEIG